MITPNQLAFLRQMYAAAKQAGHPWPKAAACEAVVETGWGEHMPQQSRNCLGIKCGRSYTGPRVSAAGSEQLPSGPMTPQQTMFWRAYPDFAACFADQIHILHTQPDGHGGLAYQAALDATTEESYIVAECRVWSTGILKGSAVLQVYHAHGGEL